MSPDQLPGPLPPGTEGPSLPEVLFQPHLGLWHVWVCVCTCASMISTGEPASPGMTNHPVGAKGQQGTAPLRRALPAIVFQTHNDQLALF